MTLPHVLGLSAPLFFIVALGYGIAKTFRLGELWTDRITKLCFLVLLPLLLFRLMTTIDAMPRVDARLLIAFFGGCFIVFLLGRVIAATVFKLDGVGQSVFALAGVFSNNVLLGLPLAKLLLGNSALPSVTLVLVFNALILWTLVTISVEWAKHGTISLQGFRRTALGIARNPILVGIVFGFAYGHLIGPLPQKINQVLSLLSDCTAPTVLFALGIGLATYPVHDAWKECLAICGLKLIVQPLVVYLLATALKLPPMETRVVVLLASIAVGVNVYLMARQFNTLQNAIASSLVLSTALAALTTPLLLALVGIS